MHAVDDGKGGVFFLYGYGGTGKTFVWKTLSAAIRSRGQIVLTVASSGIASLLLPGGRTAHSRFAIPLIPTEDSTCNIKQGSPLAELIIKTDLIIWDEAPMMNKYCFEALDKTMRDILRFSNPLSLTQTFGGKTIVFGGDFRQILPVIPKGTRQDIVLATINSSYLWQHCKVLKLTKNMRLQSPNSNIDLREIKAFSDWISNIGDGTIGGPNDGHVSIEIPDDLLIKEKEDLVESIVDSTYPNLSERVGDPLYLQERAILAPTLDVVETINEYMVSLNETEGTTYLSSDTASKSDSNIDLLDDLHTPEFLNGIRCSGVPNHELKLKVGTPVMLLRNIDHSAGLCNGTRLVITTLGKHVLEAKVITGRNAGHKVFIPRMTLTPSDSRLPFKFQRRQYPLIVSYAMTINKSQGQSLSHVGLYLKKPVFSHGQLYVAVSRVTNRSGLKILCCDRDGEPSNSTTNVVFKEVFQNLN
jgi:ATP-dependent DNA helicase PIF1